VTALVLLQQGLDVTLPLELANGGQVRQRGGARLVVPNPADRCALEWALAVADDVTALSVGPVEWDPLLWRAVARGTRRGLRLWDPGLAGLDAAALARVLAMAVRELAPAVVLAGDRGLEGATGVLPALVAAHLGWPCLDGALRVAGEPGAVVIQRRLEGGRREEMVAECPVVVTVTADSTEPRYVSVRARREAECRPIERWDLARLGIAPDVVSGWARLRVEGLDWPRPRPRRAAQAPKALSAAERMRQLVGGGAKKPATSEQLLEGAPDQVAERLLAFLESRGFV
jgi:electron transfer flavoprotein beta subunit